MSDFTQAQLTALKNAYASGQTKVRYGDKEVSYRSLEEMERAINTIQRELANESGTRKSRQVRLRSRRGL